MVSTQRITGIADNYGIFTFKDDLIWFMIENHDNWQHRELSLRLDPYIKKYIKRLDEDIWAEKPITTPDIFGSQEQDQQSLQLLNGNGNVVQDETEEIEEVDSESSANISEEWDHEKWNKLMAKMKDKARLHSYCVVCLYDAPPYWRVFCDREIKWIYYDDNDIPYKVDVEWSRALPYNDKYLNFEDTIKLYKPDMDLTELEDETRYGLLVPYGTAESEDRLGEFDLEDKWTIAIRLRYAQLDIANNSSKTSGFYQWVWGAAISSTQETNLKDAADMASYSQGIGAKRNVLEEIIAHYPEHSEFTIEAKQDFMKDFAMACGLPLVFFRSESEGGQMISSGLFSTMDEVKINKKKLYIFNQFKTFIKLLIYMRWGIELEDIEPFLYESENEEVDVPMDYESNKFNEQQNNEVMKKDGK